ncbi:MAG TPA: response regulator transcription factor, partial [Ignavibacteriales bacterium]|nr:response regulator transcription factor [Ignavibacteriales bacterium]
NSKFKDIRMKVMIADDSKIIRSRMKDLLSEYNGVKDFLETDSGAGAVRVLEENNPEILILDLSMPEGGGFHVLDYISRQKRSILTIVLTNYTSEEYQLRCKGFGVKYFYDKSSEFMKVCEIIQEKNQL